MIRTKDPKFNLRLAEPEDAELALAFMHKLGIYQKMADEITATAENLRDILASGFGEALFGYYEGEAVGFMFFSQTSSAFTGRWGLFLDGFYVEEALRHRGLGKIRMAHLAQMAMDRGGRMLEWQCLDWNAPTIRIYQSMGAYRLDGLGTYRLSPEDLRSCAAGA
ncbi:MAG: GNAT family N-acetyltransferase [Paracoccaceae bacterium]